MRVLTMNLWGVRGDWKARRALLADGLRELRPDLLTLQETVVTSGAGTTEPYDQARELLGEEYYVVHQRDRESDGQGVTTASRWPLTDPRELDLHISERTRDFRCTTLLVDVATPEGPLLLVNHFPSWKLDLEAEREAQAVLAARAVERDAPPGTHVVLAGDLDAEPRAASVRFLTGRQSLDGTSVCYRDAWESVHAGAPGHTYTPENELMADGDWPFRRIDYILVRCGEHGGPTLEVQDCQRIFDQPVDGVWPSDHYGLVADLTAR